MLCPPKIGKHLCLSFSPEISPVIRLEQTAPTRFEGLGVSGEIKVKQKYAENFALSKNISSIPK